MTVERMSLEEALDWMGGSESEKPEKLAAERLRRAGLTLMDELRRLDKKVWLMQASAKRMQEPDQYFYGHHLIEGRSDGGPRHYLNDIPVRAGTPLRLLTDRGWMPGRYEWSFEPGTPPKFYFALAGVSSAVSCALPPNARLAWPDEL